jgi:hypothetical protein
MFVLPVVLVKLKIEKYGNREINWVRALAKRTHFLSYIWFYILK